ncbi:peptide-methionine (S)-S-oxide reductase [Marinicauda salina]|uniref:Peptide methionine sulfoxide reductase MsrA n=1 Tax=Marinicauda salina TaxID=2135793 RepID=A0A2U2BQV7_9PROT|nr:peptide-methionine (S)-S-oxide reductase MsrA [Marinicauda salina]PWE16391.1 peptide-methionine (S)-S-oxide reductase [Marinicauda salina]
MRALALLLVPFALTAAACGQEARPAGDPTAADLPEGAAQAIFASGCFWCTEADFEKLDGVVEAVSGYTGGHVDNPTYRQVTGGGTGHHEAVRVIYDPDAVGYAALLDHYWRNVDPFDGGGQFCDRGPSYAPAIFTLDEDQADAARASRDRVSARFDREIAVDIEPAGDFWPAEDYHQDYAEKNPLRYSRYRLGCRRDQRLREIWGDEALGANG